jgi:hypothetical protein
MDPGRSGKVGFIVQCNLNYPAELEKRPLPIETNRGIGLLPFPPRVHGRIGADQRVFA